MRRWLHLIAALALLAASNSAAAPYIGHEHQIRLQPPRTEHAPSLDGAIAPGEWQDAATLEGFTHNRPVEGVRDTLGTTCMVMYDAHNLYVAFRCKDLPGQVQAPVTGRDNVWSGDWVGVSIDSYHDRQKAYFIIANPRGIQADGIDQEGLDSDTNPDYQYTSAGHVTPEGYEVEFAIPFKSLRFPAADRVTFGFNAIREVKRTGVHMYWAPITSDIAGYTRQIGELQDFASIRPGRNVEVNPFVTAARAGERRGPALDWHDAESRQGVGLKLGLTSALTADITVKPDFSQVEADAGVVDVNSRFAIFFPEKRPFFLEGVDIFNTPLNLVYTRRIADPLYGVKLTGKAGRTAIGVLQAADQSAGQSIESLPDRANPYFDHDAQFTIGRVRRDVSDNFSLGALATNRTQRDAFNRVAGADARLTFHKNWTMAAQAVHSWHHDPDLSGALANLDSLTTANVEPWLYEQTGTRAQGDAVHAELNFDRRTFQMRNSVDHVSRDFRTESGFVTRPGAQEWYHWFAGHLFPKDRRWYQSLEPRLQVSHVYERPDADGRRRLTDLSVRPQFVARFRGGADIGGGFNRMYSYFNGRSFEPRLRVFLQGYTDQHRGVRPGFFVSYGDDIIYSETAPAKSLSPEVWSDFRFSDQLDASFYVQGTRITRSVDGSRYATVVIPRLRVSYQFNREIAARWISEWVDGQRYGTDDVRTRHDRSLSQDLLLSYALRPGTVVYLGLGARLGANENEALHVTSQNLFMKASYLWQL